MMHFRLCVIFRHLHVSPDILIKFEINTPELVLVEMQPLTDTEIEKPYRRDDALCTAVLQKKMTRNIKSWLAETEELRPTAFSDFTDKAKGSMLQAMVRSVKLWRWRIGNHSDQKFNTSYKSFEWSINGTDWNQILLDDHIIVISRVSFAMAFTTDKIAESLLSLSRADKLEPLAHELFQEACSLRWENPRSSLVMSIAAAETGLKQLISTLVPSAEWLLKETQSPPLVKMLEEYLPKLPVLHRFAGKKVCPPKWVIDAIKDGVSRRNKIVHGHNIQLKSDSLSEVFEAVHELLYLFDFYSGNKWAMERIHRIRASLESEA